MHSEDRIVYHYPFSYDVFRFLFGIILVGIFVFPLFHSKSKCKITNFIGSERYTHNIPLAKIRNSTISLVSEETPTLISDSTPTTKNTFQQIKNQRYAFEPHYPNLNSNILAASHTILFSLFFTFCAHKSRGATFMGT